MAIRLWSFDGACLLNADDTLPPLISESHHPCSPCWRSRRRPCRLRLVARLVYQYCRTCVENGECPSLPFQSEGYLTGDHDRSQSRLESCPPRGHIVVVHAVDWPKSFEVTRSHFFCYNPSNVPPAGAHLRLSRTRCIGVVCTICSGGMIPPGWRTIGPRHVYLSCVYWVPISGSPAACLPSSVR